MLLIPKRTEVLASLKEQIPERIDLVTSRNWPLEGWRPYKNIHVWHGQPVEELRRLQKQYGEDAVTIGTAWDGEYNRPSLNLAIIGIYLKDVDAQVALLRDQMEAWNERRW